MAKVKGSTIGERLRSRRMALNWSRANLARRAGVSEGLIVKWERTDTMPRSDLLAKVCEALGVTLDEIVRGSAA